MSNKTFSFYPHHLPCSHSHSHSPLSKAELSKVLIIIFLFYPHETRNESNSCFNKKKIGNFFKQQQNNCCCRYSNKSHKTENCFGTFLMVKMCKYFTRFCNGNKRKSFVIPAKFCRRLGLKLTSHCNSNRIA